MAFALQTYSKGTVADVKSNVIITNQRRRLLDCGIKLARSWKRKIHDRAFEFEPMRIF